jgi:hypothetical protein
MEVMEPVKTRRNKDWVLLTQFVFADPGAKIDTVSVRQNSLDFIGAPKKGSRKHITGVYGTNSRDAALFLAASWADAHGKAMYLLDVWAHLPNFHATRSQLTRDILKESHWLHAERMSSALRDEFHQKALKWLLREHGPSAHAEATSQSLPTILLAYPDFALKMLDDDKDIGMLVHPVKARFDLTEEKMTFWAATIHLDRVQLVAAEVRHMPQIKVTL